MLILQLTMPPSLNQKLGNIKHKTAWNDWKYRERKRILKQLPEGFEPFSCDVYLYIDFYFPDNARRDLDNYLKALQDTLTLAGVWNDDSQVCDLIVKRQGVLPPGSCTLAIWPKSESDPLADWIL
ncbi:Crossover junction endodeoxyribonuclease rusA [Anaerobiospirillum thomasii]|uniref:Crossover junction endodeoxyribonuclease rusA n=1 Tax=Anaerobiospirillum thomasii TaxID=179995 RepID=A0A2X0WPI7_9GAMM|nr:RusA family crossover junction endodeoxyribonuclease [Anaerobiospirillum thomasii]SPT67616.1 Crossover junction endodeoxyribonuclease rusA [Anaerobiospirillum thomasii]SPT70078.1 Crossover junction endodeoxyribonuclease rusA [Anaerobiospirillum thomasii]SPT72447.1 Crossover junction endodeoxyribonuclease rusA [Anaerobiospirillum thomasii]SPT72481.1 Crossover junction endodeoxyribonuclease rusA [Anaerobiospirillum thomasii]